MTVAIVGGGPAGLACAIELRRRGIDDVLVLDRESDAGGIPRHCDHQGFGVRDLHRLTSGPRYARRYVDAARRAGALVLEAAMVTGWSADRALEVTSPGGRDRFAADAVVLATGCRERPRAARLVPGSRPEGVMTTATLQQLVQRGLTPVGRRALVVGAEHVSFSALLTLAHGGARTVGMVTELPRHESLAVFRAGAALRYRTPLWTHTRISAIHGRPRVEEVELLDLDSGDARRVACDTVVFTADWIPDHELAVMAGLEMDGATNGPRVDTGLRTSRRGVFAAGNLLHGAEPADIAAISGRHAAASAAAWVEEGSGAWPARRIRIATRRPLGWIAPSAVSDAGDPPPRSRFALRSTEFLKRPAIEVRQQGRVLWTGRVRRLVPGRSAYLPAGWIDSVDWDGGPIEITSPREG
jgi:thioredoxin reductase